METQPQGKVANNKVSSNVHGVYFNRVRLQTICPEKNIGGCSTVSTQNTTQDIQLAVM
jgi:hypothetical protein